MLNLFQYLKFQFKKTLKQVHAEFISASHVRIYTKTLKQARLPDGQIQRDKYLMKRTFHSYHVYFLTNKPRGILYIGVTGGLDDRMERHRAGKGSAFAAKYNLKRLVYKEEFQYIEDAIAREKQLKNWHREWKINLIERENPEWKDLYKPVGDSENPETSSG